MLVKTIQTFLADYANQTNAIKQQQYMKSQLPFWGVSKPDLVKLVMPVIKKAQPNNNTEYRTTLEQFFQWGTRREEWYCGIMYARYHRSFIIQENIDLYLAIIRQTQWWDITDEIAPNLIGMSLKNDREKLLKLTREWIHDHCMWVQRTALLAQLKFKDTTDLSLQTELILKASNKKEFFIRKAIGWSLREISKINPLFVHTWTLKNQNQLSPLSFKEARKRIKQGHRDLP